MLCVGSVGPNRPITITVSSPTTPTKPPTVCRSELPGTQFRAATSRRGYRMAVGPVRWLAKVVIITNEIPTTAAPAHWNVVSGSGRSYGEPTTYSRRPIRLLHPHAVGRLRHGRCSDMHLLHRTLHLSHPSSHRNNRVSGP